MIVLGIDPGTAALGYGIVERTGGRLREVDHGCLDDAARTCRCPSGCCAIHALVDELIELAPARPASPSSGCSSRATPRPPSRSARRAGVVLLAAAQHGHAGPRGDARTRSRARSPATARPTRTRSQRMVQLVLGMSELPRPDDAADALAIAIWAANTERGRVARPAAGGPGPRGGRADRPRRDRATSGPSARPSPPSAPSTRAAKRSAS